ncbi:TetR-like C-terminal domain-containing protein [Streptomyces rishiriensis]|uniref:TetR-like C-terminal domain-containing protein n=1 Tax=Streptomyces rishiriensis TaxID=68264 RepID=UPI0027D957F1|nr:TetR-like C-terminal domain-containing protein [Streptomyces rishiriensis]
MTVAVTKFSPIPNPKIGIGPSAPPAEELSVLPALCRDVRDVMFSRLGLALRSVIHECDPLQAERFQVLIFEGVVEPTVRLLHDVISREIGRGEVRADAANSYVFDAVPAVMMYRSKICACEWSDRELEETVDRLMLPLLRPGAP